MARWEPDAESRLRQSAFELFEQRGFDATTVADISERAGLTKRTFFRYFNDKREVLFSNSEEFESTFTDAVRDAPEGASPLETVAAGLYALADFLQPRGDFAPRRQALIEANPELEERELSKMASLAAAGTEALRARGVQDPDAQLAAESAVVVLRTSFASWISAGGEGELREIIGASLESLKSLA